MRDELATRLRQKRNSLWRSCRPVECLLKLVLAAIGAVVLGIGIALLLGRMGLTPSFPVYAGEDDFNVRIQYFLAVVCPGFAIAGVWIGHVFARDKRASWSMVVAFVMMTIAVPVTTRMAALSSEVSAGRDAANHAVLLFFVAWVIVLWSGIAAVHFLVRRR